jgi:hypothetical protein
MVDFKAVKTGVLGIAGIAIILLILLLIFGNLSGNVGFVQDSTTTAVQALTLANTSIVTFTGTSGKTNPSVSSVVVINATGGETITSGNYTLTGTTITGSPTMTLKYNGTVVNVSYVTTYDSDNQISTSSVIGNVTSGVTDLASKFTTVFVLLGVLLILAVVFTIVKLFGLGGKKGLIE